MMLKPGDTLDTMMPAAEMEAAAAKARARENALIAEHPILLADEPPRIILLAEAGAHRTHTWLSGKLAHVEFALVSAHRDLGTLRQALATGIRPDTDDVPMNAAQIRMARLGNVRRHQELRQLLKRDGYKTWMTVAGEWRNKQTGETTREMALFVPNADLVDGHADLPFERQFKPHLQSSVFAARMRQLADLFVQEAHIVRADGKMGLVNSAKGQVIKAFGKRRFGGQDAMKKMLKDLKEGGHLQPRSSGIRVRFDEEMELVDAAAFPRTVLNQGRIGVFGMMAISGSALADQIIEWT